MKKIFLTIVALSLGIGTMIYAQSVLSLTVDGTKIKNGETITVRDIPQNADSYIKALLTLTNTSAAEIKISGVKKALILPAGTMNTWCLFGNCFSSDDLGGEHAMAAGATEGADGHAYTEYWPMGGTDSAKVHYAFWVVGTSDTLNVNIVYKVEEKVANEVLSSTKASISAYPNPACEQVHFKMNLNNNSFALLVLRDLSGKMVKTMDVTGQNEVSLSLNGMKPGFYFYSVMQNNASVAVGKLVVR